MKRIPRRTAKRVFPVLLVLMLCCVFAFVLWPAAKPALGAALAVLLVLTLAMAQCCFRCPACGSQTHPKDDTCLQCGAKLEE